jgi:sensor histidine kinase regulating citrate/malate metabolism
MEWLIIGAVLGVAGLRLASWANAKKISIKWYVWILVVLAVLMTALTAMDYNTLILGMEPSTARVVLWLFGGPALILALIAVGLVWWQNRKTINAPTES